MWIDDKYWQHIPSLIACLSKQHKYFLVPSDFAGLDKKCYPLGFGQAISKDDLTGFAIPKDDLDRLPKWLLLSSFANFYCIYANEVFVVFSKILEDQIVIHKYENAIKNHLPYFLDRHKSYLAGKFFRQESINRNFHNDPSFVSLKKGNLLVNANGMGNFGDELLIQSVVKSLLKHQPLANIIVVRPDFNPPIDAQYERIVIGGGGILYDMSVTASGTQLNLENVANYFRYAFLAKEMGASFIVAGVGTQHLCIDYVSNDSRWFMSQALNIAQTITTRDTESAKRLLPLTTTSVKASVDLAFYLREEMLQASQLVCQSNKKISLVGELTSKPELRMALIKFMDNHAFNVRYVAQANEDIEHFNSLSSFSRRDNLTLADVRFATIDSGLKEIASSSYIITSRFHTMVCALVMGIPFIAIDNSYGKKSRLLREISGLENPPWLLNWSVDASTYLDKFESLVSGNIPRFDKNLVEVFASQVIDLDHVW